MTSQRVKILIVDDEEHVVESLKRTLRHENYEVITHTSPVQALARLREGDIDILLSDIDMPEMTGLELISLARADHPEVARILLTGDSSMESAVTAINEGAVHKYLTKPWRSDALRESLRGIVASLDVLRKQAVSDLQSSRSKQEEDDLEARYPGFASVRRVEGSYLLNDLRIVERLSRLGGAVAALRAASWLPSDNDRTEDLRGR